MNRKLCTRQSRDDWPPDVADVVVAASGGVLSLAGVLDAWLSWMITVLVEVEERLFWSESFAESFA